MPRQYRTRSAYVNETASSREYRSVDRFANELPGALPLSPLLTRPFFHMLVRMLIAFSILMME